MTLLGPDMYGGERVAPRTLTSYDFSRCYVLYDDVDCNIPRWGSVGEYGAWDHARGVLVELCRALPATPVRLHLRELDTPTRAPVGWEITAVARDHTGAPVTVVSRRETWPYSLRGDFWQVHINGVVPGEGTAIHPPSLPWLARLVRNTLQADRRRPPGTR